MTFTATDVCEHPALGGPELLLEASLESTCLRCAVHTSAVSWTHLSGGAKGSHTSASLGKASKRQLMAYAEFSLQLPP